MGWFGRSNPSKEDVIKHYDSYWLDGMNDLELEAEVLFSLGQIERIEEGLVDLRAAADDRGLVFSKAKHVDDKKPKKKVTTTVTTKHRVIKGYSSGDKPFVAFVGASPSRLDMVRGRGFTGPVGKTLQGVYFSALGVKNDDALLTNIVPYAVTDVAGNPREPTSEELDQFMPAFKAELAEAGIKLVVGLGRSASSALGKAGILDEFVPHPRAINTFGDSGEVSRKLSRLAKKVTNADSLPVKVMKRDSTITASISKTDDDLQLVYGVVIEPEVEDTDGNWTSAEEIEKTAHQFMIHSQTMGLEHAYKAEDVFVVESFIAPEDFELGEQEVAKGSWILGVKVFDDGLWDLVKSGEINGFSFGGTATIDPDKRV